MNSGVVLAASGRKVILKHGGGWVFGVRTKDITGHVKLGEL